MTTKADRPYGTFPRDAAEEVATPAALAGTPRGLRAWLRARSGRERVELVLTAILVVIATVLLASAAPRSPRIAQLAVPDPTPTPTIPELYAKVAQSVVSIRVGSESNGGSGVVLDDQGTILTALHVVNGQSDITVTFADGTQAPARILTTLPDSDIAALRTLRRPAVLVPAVLGNPDTVQIGDDAIVIGNPFGLTRSLSTGVISGLGRSIQVPGRSKPLEGLIQFDASVNPGSSGGPLLNREGDVIGIVTALANPSNQRSFSGVGFAVRIDLASSAAGLPPD